MNFNQRVSVLITRLILGFIFLFQGYGKIFNIGVENLYAMDFFQGTFKDILPDFIIRITAYYTSYIELLGGFLLIIGYKTNYALYALASVIIIVTIGHGLAEPIWDLSHVFPRTILLILLLILPRDWDTFSVDNLISKLTRSK